MRHVRAASAECAVVVVSAAVASEVISLIAVTLFAKTMNLLRPKRESDSHFHLYTHIANWLKNDDWSPISDMETKPRQPKRTQDDNAFSKNNQIKPVKRLNFHEDESRIKEPHRRTKFVIQDATFVIPILHYNKRKKVKSLNP